MFFVHFTYAALCSQALPASDLRCLPRGGQACAELRHALQGQKRSVDPARALPCSQRRRPANTHHHSFERPATGGTVLCYHLSTVSICIVQPSAAYNVYCHNLAANLEAAKPAVGFTTRCKRDMVFWIQLERCSTVADGSLQAHSITG